MYVCDLHHHTTTLSFLNLPEPPRHEELLSPDVMVWSTVGAGPTGPRGTGTRRARPRRPNSRHYSEIIDLYENFMIMDILRMIIQEYLAITWQILFRSELRITKESFEPGLLFKRIRSFNASVFPSVTPIVRMRS